MNNMHTFYAKLPKGYQLKSCVDIYHNVSFGRLLLRAFAVLSGSLAIILTPLAFDPSYAYAELFILTLILFGVPATVIYSDVYALIQRIIYKRATGEVGLISYTERFGYCSPQHGFVTPELTRLSTRGMPRGTRST